MHKSQDLTWITYPSLNQSFDQGDPELSLSRSGSHDPNSKTRDESAMKACALTVKEGGSPKEIWGVTKEKQMLGRQNNKYANQWTVKKLMLELNFKG